MAVIQGFAEQLAALPPNLTGAPAARTYRIATLVRRPALRVLHAVPGPQPCCPCAARGTYARTAAALRGDDGSCLRAAKRWIDLGCARGGARRRLRRPTAAQPGRHARRHRRGRMARDRLDVAIMERRRGPHGGHIGTPPCCLSSYGRWPDQLSRDAQALECPSARGDGRPAAVPRPGRRTRGTCGAAREGLRGVCRAPCTRRPRRVGAGSDWHATPQRSQRTPGGALRRQSGPHGQASAQTAQMTLGARGNCRKHGGAQTNTPP